MQKVDKCIFNLDILFCTDHEWNQYYKTATKNIFY